MKKYIIMLNCPSYRNDKQWLVDVISGEKVSYEVVDTKLYLSTMCTQGITKRILFYFRIIKHACRGILNSKPGDVLICWNRLTGAFANRLNELLGNQRIVVSMNWLTPSQQKSKWANFEKRQLCNPNCKIIVNSPKEKERWLQKYQVEDIGNIFFIPDIYNTNVEFTNVGTIKKKERKYIFVGGMNNRDWNKVVDMAKLMPDIKFICCALKEDWCAKVTSYPSNVEVHFNIRLDEYYKYMKSAYLVLLPLVTDKVSGLINIAYAAQYGVLCLVNDYEFSSMYYGPECRELLMSADTHQWVEMIQKLYELSWDEYVDKVEAFQKYIKKNFSPQVARDVIMSITK